LTSSDITHYQYTDKHGEAVIAMADYQLIGHLGLRKTTFAIG